VNRGSVHAVIGLVSSCCLVALGGCSTSAPAPSADIAAYERALAATDPAKKGHPEAGSPVEKQAVDAFIEFYEDFTASQVQKRVRALYAADSWFRDPFKEVSGIDEVEKYFLGSTEAIEACSFDIQHWVGKDGEYYFRWVMSLRLKRSPDDEIRGVGMTHVRFDREGHVSFHQDYWDTGGILYERFPLIGGVLRKIRSRM
jgi:hypothetical protein